MKDAIKFLRGKAKEDDQNIIRCYRHSNIEELLALLPCLMDTLLKMFKLQLPSPTRYTQVALPALSMILRDLTILWISLSEGMIRMLDLFFNLPTACHSLLHHSTYRGFSPSTNRRL